MEKTDRIRNAFISLESVTNMVTQKQDCLYDRKQNIRWSSSTPWGWLTISGPLEDTKQEDHKEGVRRQQTPSTHQRGSCVMPISLRRGRRTMGSLLSTVSGWVTWVRPEQWYYWRPIDNNRLWWGLNAHQNTKRTWCLLNWSGYGDAAYKKIETQVWRRTIINTRIECTCKPPQESMWSLWCQWKAIDWVQGRRSEFCKYIILLIFEFCKTNLCNNLYYVRRPEKWKIHFQVNQCALEPANFGCD